ncbi:MAG TPA: hypothetical protein VFW42_01765 [Fluviicoccus sp.]|nr:hypothetical protein [Fluviicoccus sp.]
MPISSIFEILRTAGDAKSGFSLHGADVNGKTVLRKIIGGNMRLL